MVDRGVLPRGDRLRGTTSAIDLGLDLRPTIVKSNIAGKTRGAVTPTGGLMKNVVEKRTCKLQIKSGFVKRRVAVLRSVIAWTKTIAGKHPASPRGWPVKGLWRTSGARRRKRAPAIVGHIDLR
jgi:hypothetical protein